MEEPVILLVEDNEDDAALAIRVLQKFVPQARIHHEFGGLLALTWLEELDHPIPQLVLLDLKMTLMSGVDVLRRIRANSRLCELPVVILTSSRETNDIADCYQAGANSFVVKPVDFQQFRSTVCAVAKYWLNSNTPSPERT